jgi:hypothetical protein
VIRKYKSISGADQSGPAPNFDYRACFEILQESRTSLGFQPCQNSLALATVDPESEGQDRFITAIIITRVFELFRALRDFVEKRRGKAAIGFFRRYLDPRFGIAGLFEAESKVKFIDLEPHSERILGCDVRQIGTGPRSRAQGISGL